MSVKVIHGDCRAVLAQFEADSFSACCTDPPYELNFMSRAWDRTGIAFRPETWAAVLRVLRPGAYFVAFASARGYHRMACAIEDAGFVIHPMLGWITASGFPKATSVSKAIDRAAGAEREIVGVKSSNRTNVIGKRPGNSMGGYYGLQSLKPALEPICLAQKPFSEKTGFENVLRWGTGALNIDSCRVPADWANDPSKRGLGYGFTRKGDQTSGMYAPPVRSEYDTTKGRWPANLAHDGSPEVLAAFARFGEKGGGDGKDWSAGSEHGTGNGATYLGRKPTGQHFADTGTAARFFFCGKATKDDRMGTTHPTTKPTELIKWLCKLINPPGGTILDPFAGSGTLAVAATRLGMEAVLIDSDHESIAMINRRLRMLEEETPLFPPEVERDELRQGNLLDGL